MDLWKFLRLSDESAKGGRGVPKKLEEIHAPLNGYDKMHHKIDKKPLSHYRFDSMLLQILKSKIHRATVTDANVNYEGSITLDADLMEKAGLYVNEMVHIWDATEGHRLYTYCMPPAPRGSGTVCINGAAAHLIKTGHIIIITSFINLTLEEYKTHKPNKVIVDDQNRVKQIKHE